MSTLVRRLGTVRAAGIGVASMVGAGIFYAWAPAASAAGGALLIGLLVAALVATLNALSTTQLAVAHPVSGGVYAYARATIGPWTGFAAGWLFLCGKSASAGAIALIAGSYLWPGFAVPVAVAVVVVLALVNGSGIRSTAAVAMTLTGIVLLGLVVLLAIAWSGAAQGTRQISPIDLSTGTGVVGVLQSAGLLFFSFAGYARMATLGEEVVNPRRTLPRAIGTALAVTLAVYAAVGTTCVLLLGTDALSASSSPLADLIARGGPAVTSTVAGTGASTIAGTVTSTGIAQSTTPTAAIALAVGVIAAIACIGSLIGVLAGLSRTSLAMARQLDLPGALSTISRRTASPVIAEAAIAAVVVLGILFLDPLRLVSFSSCAVLCYYAIAHLAALRQAASDRWMPRAIQLGGLVGCAALALTLPWQAVVGTAIALVGGLVLRALSLWRRKANRPEPNHEEPPAAHPGNVAG